MHEEALVRDLRRELEAIARREGGTRIVRVEVRLGALSHFTEPRFRTVWPRVVDGTAAADAELDVATSEDPRAAEAEGVLVVRVVVDDAGPGNAARAPPPPIEPGTPRTSDRGRS